MAKALCEANKIVYNSRSELETALRSLVNSNYIKVAFATGSNVGLITDITPEGVEYVEEYLGIPTNEPPTGEPTPPDDGKTTTHHNDDVQTLYKTAENYKDIEGPKTEA